MSNVKLLYSIYICIYIFIIYLSLLFIHCLLINPILLSSIVWPEMRQIWIWDLPLMKKIGVTYFRSWLFFHSPSNNLQPIFIILQHNTNLNIKFFINMCLLLFSLKRWPRRRPFLCSRSRRLARSIIPPA